MTCMHRGIMLLAEAETEREIRIQRVKNRLRHPTQGGWSDVLVNFAFVSGPAAGHVCELQFVHSALMAVRSNMGAHEEYAVFRAAQEILQLGAHAGIETATAVLRRLTQDDLDGGEQPAGTGPVEVTKEQDFGDDKFIKF